MTQTRIKLIKTKPGGALALAEETISRHDTLSALDSLAFAFKQRLEALRAEADARETSLEQEYLAEVARIVAETE